MLSQLATRDSELSQQESTLIAAEQRHNECANRVLQANRSMQQACDDLKEFAVNLEAPEDASVINGSSAEACLTTLSAMDSFYNEVYPQFMEKKKACEVATNDESVSAEQCDADKAAIEESWCGLHAARVQACNELQTCYNGKSKSFDDTIEMTKLLEENTKKHVQKYIDACVQHNDCTSGTIDIAKLSVNRPTKPSMLDCDDTIKSDWDYSHVQCSGEEKVDVPEESAPSESTGNETSTSTEEANAEATLAQRESPTQAAVGA